ncbi:hypothetical protein G3N95_03565 [Paraburkholderia sp. Tr-20389]|uniref:hypothetical protein n=1 Tax=Paraburkholderia sp. Tr-20389 TaxID=2703903 RepID=UPI00197DB71C|nr:hypothetical protein [Paraburkholderia sp. Tr-20389]MBN3752004.1 hypothetical protein [Paraburkholderia sp. Tr-20389]
MLLSGKGKTRLINRLAQMAMRRKVARYTHVAIVVDDTYVVDAMPRVGVRFRRWADIADKFSIEECRVARHPDIERNAETRRKIFQHARFYLKQRYALWALVRARERFTHGSGLVCSQFVCRVLEKLEIESSAQPADKSLPADIDAFTRVTPWIQFPMMRYGLCWERGNAGSPLKDGPLNQARALAETLSNFRVKEAEFLHDIGTMSDQIAIATSIMVVSKKHEGGRRRRTNGRTRADSTHINSSAITGSELLKTWREMYLGSIELEVIFAYQEGRPSVLKRSRENFHQSLVQLLATMEKVNASSAGIQDVANVLTIPLEGLAVTKESLGQIRELLVSTLEGSSVLGLEPEETIQQRVDSVPSLQEELRSRADVIDDGTIEKAINSLGMLIDIDRERLQWIRNVMLLLPPAIDLANVTIQYLEKKDQQ